MRKTHFNFIAISMISIVRSSQQMSPLLNKNIKFVDISYDIKNCDECHNGKILTVRYNNYTVSQMAIRTYAVYSSLEGTMVIVESYYEKGDTVIIVHINEVYNIDMETFYNCNLKRINLTEENLHEIAIKNSFYSLEKLN